MSRNTGQSMNQGNLDEHKSYADETQNTGEFGPTRDASNRKISTQPQRSNDGNDSQPCEEHKKQSTGSASPAFAPDDPSSRD